MQTYSMLRHIFFTSLNTLMCRIMKHSNYTKNVYSVVYFLFFFIFIYHSRFFYMIFIFQIDGVSIVTEELSTRVLIFLPSNEPLYWQPYLFQRYHYILYCYVHVNLSVLRCCDLHRQARPFISMSYCNMLPNRIASKKNHKSLSQFSWLAIGYCYSLLLIFIIENIDKFKHLKQYS